MNVSMLLSPLGDYKSQTFYCGGITITMKLLLVVFVLCFVAVKVQSECQEVYAKGISEEGKQEVVDVHNKLRKKIANGKVKNQPRGVNLLEMSYDDVLGEKGRVVSEQCDMEHVRVKDDRFSHVGQNLHAKWSSAKDCSQNWTEAVTNWFREHKLFVYPNSQSKPGQIGHYTQVVWATSYKVGCDFICYHDKNEPKYPYTRLYTCNYGPGGNIRGQAPYKNGTSGCENLCSPTN